MEPRTRKHWLGIAALAAVACFAGGGLFIARNFPFRRDVLIRKLHALPGTHVEVGQFTEDWFTPGFSAAKIRLSDRDGDVLTLDRLIVRTNYSALIGKPTRLREVDLTGLRVWIQPHRTGALQPFGVSHLTASRPAFRIDEIRLENAQLDVPRDVPGRPPLEFAFHAAVIHGIGPNETIRFEATAHNPIPSGEVHLKGEARPFSALSLREMPVQVQFTYENADLTVPHSISGLLNATGNCRGTMGHLECAGTGDVPRFQVFGSAHAVHIASSYNVAVDPLTGNADLREIVARFSRTVVSANGNVAAVPDGKALTLNMSIRDGRLEDLLALFTSAPTPRMRAALDMRGRFVIPPGPPDFLSKLKADGEVFLRHAFFTNPNSQTPINRLSASGEGEPRSDQRQDPQTETADAHAFVATRHGIANLNGVTFSFPGIQGRLAGTFTLREQQIHLNGDFQTQGKLSDTSSGVKAMVLKVLGKVWPRSGGVKTIPFVISGRGSNASFRLQFHQK